MPCSFATYLYVFIVWKQMLETFPHIFSYSRSSWNICTLKVLVSELFPHFVGVYYLPNAVLFFQLSSIKARFFKPLSTSTFLQRKSRIRGNTHAYFIEVLAFEFKSVSFW